MRILPFSFSRKPCETLPAWNFSCENWERRCWADRNVCSRQPGNASRAGDCTALRMRSGGTPFGRVVAYRRSPPQFRAAVSPVGLNPEQGLDPEDWKPMPRVGAGMKEIRVG